MASPPPAAVAAIRSFADWTQDNPAVLAALNAPSLPNPAPQGTVPLPPTVSALMATLDAAALGNLVAFPSLPRLLDDINKGDLAAVGLWAGLLHATGKVTDAQYAALGAVLAATGPDPAWQAQVSWALANIGRPADLDDVLASRPTS